MDDPDHAPEPALTVQAEPATLTDRIISMAKAAGPDGITRAQIRAEHGDTAYAIVDSVVASGDLIRVGRGQYRHPEHTE